MPASALARTQVAVVDRQRCDLHRVPEVHRALPRRSARDGGRGVAALRLQPAQGARRPSRRTVTVVTCDVLVVGGGPAGLVAAREAAARDRGLDVLLVE